MPNTTDVLSCCVIILRKKGELVALLRLSSCLCSVSLPHGAVNGLQFVSVVCPGHTHFCKQFSTKRINIYDRQLLVFAIHSNMFENYFKFIVKK